MIDTYEICRQLNRYRQKNGYSMRIFSPELALLGVTREFLDALVKNDVVMVLPLYLGGAPVVVALTEKGRRMATSGKSSWKPSRSKRRRKG